MVHDDLHTVLLMRVMLTVAMITTHAIITVHIGLCTCMRMMSTVTMAGGTSTTIDYQRATFMKIIFHHDENRINQIMKEIQTTLIIISMKVVIMANITMIAIIIKAIRTKEMIRLGIIMITILLV